MGKDSAEGIASELVGAGLVDGKDITAITTNLQKLIDMRDSIKVVTFPLVSVYFFDICLTVYLHHFLQNSGYENDETPDDKALVGFAQISITD